MIELNPKDIARANALNAIIDRSVELKQLDWARTKAGNIPTDGKHRRLHPVDADKLCSLLNIGGDNFNKARRGLSVNAWVAHRVDTALAQGADDFKSLCAAMRKYRDAWHLDEFKRQMVARGKQLIESP